MNRRRTGWTFLKIGYKREREKRRERESRKKNEKRREERERDKVV